MTSSAPWWPLTELRVAAPRVTLRPLTEDDLAPLAEQLPADVELDPALPGYDGIDVSVARGTSFHQTYWRALGGWRPESWDLLFAVVHDGEVVGVQSLESDDFPRRRTVETWSFLLPVARGRGVGKAMRRAALTLAFDHLGALAAETEALQGNGPSLGVSRAVGYEPNGETLHPHGDRLDVMLHMRLTRERWAARGGAPDVRVTGLDACRHLFGG